MPIPASKSLSEECIRPERLMIQKQALVEEDRAFLLSRRNEWEKAPCPTCGKSASGKFGEKNGFVYVVCKACETVYTNPRPSRSLLHKFYAQSKNYEFWNNHIFPATAEIRRREMFRPRALQTIDYCKKYGIAGGTLMEVGAAFGIYCEEIRDRGYFQKIIGVEPTPALAATCRKKGVEVRECPVEDIGESDFADVVAAFEVIEHLYSPRDFIRACMDFLRPGGLLILSCPNVKGFDVSILGTGSGTFDHEHLNYFHPWSLSHLLERSGLKVLEVNTPGQLDAGLVRDAVLNKPSPVQLSPFLEEVLIVQWKKLGASFQNFLVNHQLSSHMWAVAQKTVS